MISEFKTIPKAVYYVQTADGCSVLDPDGDTLAEITAPGGYFPGIASADGGPGTVTFSAPVKRVVGPFDLAPQLLLTLLGQLGGNGGLPAGFKRVAYLEANSVSEEVIVNTNVLPDTNTGWLSDGFFTQDKESWPVSAYSPPNRYYFCGGFSSAGRKRIAVGQAGNGTQPGRYSYMTDSRFKAYVNFKNSRTIKLERDGTAESLPLGTAISKMEDSLYIFGRANNPCYYRLFNLQISHGEEILRHYIPCLDATGAPCLFDLVTRKPFYNQGTGDFLYPTASTASTTYGLRRVLPDWGKLTEHGLRRLYHAPASYKGELIDYALEHRYKPIVETEQPTEGYWAPRWTETDDEIVLEWVEAEPPMNDYLTQPTE